MYKIRNIADIVLATFLNAENSLSLSFLASLSIGLQRKILIEEAITKQVNIIMLSLVVTVFIMSKNNERSRVDETRHIVEDFR